ncbi:MAG: GNAT family N-acetyltransferase [Pyrinomonadaceae bacterium]
MEIRRLQQSDYILLASAIRILVPLVSDEPISGQVINEVFLKQALNDKNCYYILCLDNSTPVGYLSAFRFPAVETADFQIYLYDIAVEERFRRLGLGSRMIEELKRHCGEDKFDFMWVGTSLDNEAAQKTFEKTGARKVSETYVEYIYDF